MPHIDGKANSNTCIAVQEFAIEATLEGYVQRVRAAHAGLISALSNAVQHAVDAGQALLAAKNTPYGQYGQWTKFLRRCDLGERQAERYMHLARLVEANPTCKSDLAGLTIETAIKKLSPPKPQVASPARSQNGGRNENTDVKPSAATATHADILEVWLRASPAAQERAVDALGVRGWFNAAPKHWRPHIEQLLLAEQKTPIVAVAAAESAPNDLTIPEFLRRAPDVEEDNANASIDDGVIEDEVEEDDEPKLEKPKRKPPKLIDCSQSITEAIDCVFSDLGELGCDCREAVDTTPENFQQTERIQALEAAADELENLEALEVPEVLSKIPVKYSLPRRRYVSRDARASDAEAILTACQRALEVIADDDDRHADAQSLIDDLQSVIDTLGQCEFPGAFQ